MAGRISHGHAHAAEVADERNGGSGSIWRSLPGSRLLARYLVALPAGAAGGPGILGVQVGTRPPRQTVPVAA